MDKPAYIKSGLPLDSAPIKWSLKRKYEFLIILGLCGVALIELANPLWDPHLRQFTLMLGVIGVWRYLWWSVHAFRAEIYGKTIFPRIRKQADLHWKSGWRPQGIHILITTYNEDKRTSELVLQSLIAEQKELGMPMCVWLGSNSNFDEAIYENYLRLHARDRDIELKIIRQNQPGKRMAIGSILRAMSRFRIGAEEFVVFMDGDSILSPGSLRKCLPIFVSHPELQALTTDEEVICFGPAWIEQWLKMRFSQRRIAMQSHSLSRKVLTLTGRMSMFRAEHITSLEFIRTLEADHLDHWLWGKFRFLSGDDKSTWYYLLQQSAEMIYVPDVTVFTVEYISGSGLERMHQNFRRWSGNMLRNGTRAIALGPQKVGFFIWWCLVDQRISIWTTLISPLVATSLSLLVDPAFLSGYLVWILCSRLLLSLYLYHQSREIYWSWVILLYLNQILNSIVKIYCLFRLSRQQWSNRGNQTSDARTNWKKEFMASYSMTVWVSALVVFVSFYTGLLAQPGWLNIRYLTSGF
jgi:glycosyltransferase Alg8